MGGLLATIHSAYENKALFDHGATYFFPAMTKAGEFHNYATRWMQLPLGPCCYGPRRHTSHSAAIAALPMPVSQN